jgi:DNA/RNA-binding domain of Phe-tRNA-synthetase-like protein
MLVAVEGVRVDGAGATPEALLEEAEAFARSALRDRSPDELPHVAAWRDAYRAFGAKPRRTRNSLEALLRRAETGLPRVNPLTDIYNAVSVLHQIPIGGEDLDRYDGPARLVRATGDEVVDTMADGRPATEHPDPGEIVWRDDTGVTCRRWNWRQGRRTALRDTTTRALFILDALDPLTERSLRAAAEQLTGHLEQLGPDVRSASRLIGGTAAES